MQALRHVRCSQPVVVHEAHASVPRLLDGTAVQTIQSRAEVPFCAPCNVFQWQPVQVLVWGL